MNKFSKLALGLFVAIVAVTTLGVTAAHAYSFNTNLSIGMTSGDVQQLQMVLNMDPATMVASTGAGSPGMESMYFGALTKAAVIRFQQKFASEVLAPAGLTQATGFVGLYSRAKLNSLSTTTPVSTVPGCAVGAMFSSTTGASCTGPSTFPAGCTSAAGFSMTTGQPCSTPSTPTPVVGGEGSLTVSLSSTPSGNQTIKYDESKAVYGIKMKADPSSDIKVNRVDFSFTDRAWRYFSTASLWDGPTKVAEMALSASTVDEITVGTEYRVRFSDVNFVVPANTEKTMTLKLTGVSVVNNPNTSMSISVPSNGIRYTDGAGLVQYDGGLGSRTVTLSDSSTGNLTITLDQSSPKEGITIVNDSDVTDDATVLVAGFKSTQNDSTIHTMAFTISTATTNVEDVVDAVNLYKGSTLVAGATITGASTSTAIATFDDLNEMIAKDQTVKYTVKVNLKELTGNYVANQTVMASITPTTIISTTDDGIDAEDAAYNTLTNNEISGGAIGEAQHLYVDAPVVSLVSISATKVSNGATGVDTGTFTIKFTVNAQGSDIYVDQTATVDNDNNGANNTAASGANFYNNGSVLSPSGVLNSTADTASNGMFKVTEGSSETFTLTTAATGNNAFNAVYLTSFGWTTNSLATNGTNVYNFGLSQDYKTDSIYLAGL